jgi:hypothetical protein
MSLVPWILFSVIQEKYKWDSQRNKLLKLRQSRFYSTNITFLDIILRPAYILKHNVSETAFCLRLQAKPTRSGQIDRASPHLRTPVPAPRWCIQAKHSSNHLRELRKY